APRAKPPGPAQARGGRRVSIRRGASRLRLAALVALSAALIAGCGGSDNTTTSLAGSDPGTTTQQVVGESGGGNFNPAESYHDASPGVVTITSVFDNGGGSAILGGRAQAGAGSGVCRPKAGEVITK